MKTDLSEFPHILKEIRLRWGTPPWLEKYVASIMVQDRDHRDGFPPSVFTQLNRILEVHRLFFGKAEDWKPEPCFNP